MDADKAAKAIGVIWRLTVCIFILTFLYLSVASVLDDNVFEAACYALIAHAFKPLRS